MKLLPTLAAFPLIASASAALAGAYTGNWPITVTRSGHADGTYCLTLKDNGTLGWPHSGQASIVGRPLGGETLFGTFQVIDHLLTATMQQQSDTGQNAGLVFSARAHAGSIGDGIYDQVYGGEEFDSGEIAFGPKNSY